MKKMIVPLPVKNVNFNTGYKYNMDILQNVKGRKIQYIKLVLRVLEINEKKYYWVLMFKQNTSIT
jgi:hypothetical protein